MDFSSYMAESLQTEAERMDSLISAATAKEPPIRDIVELYHQIINVSAIIAALRQQPDIAEDVLQTIAAIEGRIYEFNSVVHPRIEALLEAEIIKTAEYLRDQDMPNTQKVAGGTAVVYKRLREQMSTAEFVSQYGRAKQ